MLPLRDSSRSHVDESIVDLAARRNDDDISDASRSRCLGRLLQPGRHLGLARLVERDNVEEYIAVRLLDCGDGRLDLAEGEGIKGVGGGFWDYGTHCEAWGQAWRDYDSFW